MFDDFRQFLKVYRTYKKGKRQMDKAKEFISEHKKEIIFAIGGIMMFKMGYNKGWRDYKHCVNNVFDTMKKHGYNVVQLIEPKGVK